MSAGHKHKGNIESAEVEKAINDPKVKTLLAKPYSLNRDYDLPYLAGYSQDGSTIYIDRHLPQDLGYDGSLETHEHVEKSVIDGLGYRYPAAHEVATSMERRAVVASGRSWGEYSKALQPYIKADEIEKLQKCPPDLDLTPYESLPENHPLLKRLKAADIKEYGSSKVTGG